jgi:pilus assembly protein Flp/PilA
MAVCPRSLHNVFGAVITHKKEPIVIEKTFQLLRHAAFAEGANLKEKAQAFVHDDEGATMVEYGLMVALIAIVCITAVTSIGTNLNVIFSDIAAAI